MWGRVVISYVFCVAVMTGIATFQPWFPWFGLNAVLWFAVFLALATFGWIGLLKFMGKLGGGGGTASATYQSKGSRGNDR